MTDHIRQGFGSVRPYVHGPATLPEFLAEVFGATELERHQLGPQSFHVEMRLGDSVLVAEAGELPPHVEPWLNSVYVYVADVDAAHAAAMRLGAESIAAPEDKHYQERQAGFRDAAGNTWWVATYTG